MMDSLCGCRKRNCSSAAVGTHQIHYHSHILFNLTFFSLVQFCLFTCVPSYHKTGKYYFCMNDSKYLQIPRSYLLLQGMRPLRVRGARTEALFSARFKKNGRRYKLK